MNTSDSEEKQINLTYKEAADLAFQDTQDDADSLILLLMGIKELRSPVEIDILIDSAITELVRTSSVYTELRDDYIRILVRKYRQK
jgi:hypothetical protein